MANIVKNVVRATSLLDTSDPEVAEYNQLIFNLRKDFEKYHKFYPDYYIQKYKADAYVYFVYQSETGLTKIGFTTDIDNRLSALGRKGSLLLKGTIPCHRVIGYQIERDIHKNCEAIKVHGEWFRFKDEKILAKYIIACQEQYRIKEGRMSKFEYTYQRICRQRKELFKIDFVSPAMLFRGMYGYGLDSRDWDWYNGKIKEVNEFYAFITMRNEQLHYDPKYAEQKSLFEGFYDTSTMGTFKVKWGYYNNQTI